jgi:hypothetical protein
MRSLKGTVNTELELTCQSLAVTSSTSASSVACGSQLTFQFHRLYVRLVDDPSYEHEGGVVREGIPVYHADVQSG